MAELNFITIGDENYYRLINYSIKKIKTLYPDSNIFIYDWGFTQKQRNFLISYSNLKVINWESKLDRENGFKSIITDYEGYNPPRDIRKNEYNFIQKPNCILDCVKRVNNNLIFIDGDAFLINKIDEIFEYDFNIGVTLNPENAIKYAAKLDIKSPLNSGVIFLKGESEDMQKIVKFWIDEIKITKRVWIEQTALANFIEKQNPEIFNHVYNKGIVKIDDKKFKVQILPCKKYNMYWVEKGFNPTETKIIHLKGRTKKIKKIISEIKIRYIYNEFTHLFPLKVRKIIGKEWIIKKIVNFIINPKKIEKIRNNITKLIKLRKLFFAE